MRRLASQLSTYLFRKKPGNVPSLNASPQTVKEELSMEDQADRKIGWLLKMLFIGTASAVGYNVFPYMGDNLIQQSVSLLHVKDPWFKRQGASRLARIAINDERRMKIVETGGAQQLLKMLGDAKDDRTRKEALKAIAALSNSDEACGVLHKSDAVSIIRSIPDSTEDAEIQNYKSSLLKKFKDLKHGVQVDT